MDHAKVPNDHEEEKTPGLDVGSTRGAALLHTSRFRSASTVVLLLVKRSAASRCVMEA